MTNDHDLGHLHSIHAEDGQILESQLPADIKDLDEALMSGLVGAMNCHGRRAVIGRQLEQPGFDL